MKLRAWLIVLTAFAAFSNANGQALQNGFFGIARALEFSNAPNMNLILAQNPNPVLEKPSVPEKPGAGTLLFGPLQFGYAGQAISLRLITWSLPWIAAGVIGLWVSNDPYWKGFWGMNAAWGLINTGIAYAGLLGAEPDPAGLRTTLFINAGLDVVYVVGGLYLLTRPEDTWRGSGVSVIIQGAFLLAFDLLHAFLVQGT